MKFPVSRFPTFASLAVSAAALAALPAIAAAAASAPTADGATVFRCATKDGRTVFSDEPCVGANRVQVWKPKVVASGMVGHRRTWSGDVTVLEPPLSRPVSYDAGPPSADDAEMLGRICKLPDDAARQMFRSQ